MDIVSNVSLVLISVLVILLLCWCMTIISFIVIRSSVSDVVAVYCAIGFSVVIRDSILGSFYFLLLVYYVKVYVSSDAQARVNDRVIGLTIRIDL